MNDINMGGGLGEGVDVGGVREDVNKVTEEDRKRVQENNQKAKKVGQQIKKDKQINNNIAEFIGHLLNTLKSEKIVIGIYQVFFKVKNTKTNITYLRKNPNNMVIIGVFAPFYKKEIEKFKLGEFFDELIENDSGSNLESYIKYLKKLSAKYHDNIPINKHDFLEFLLDVVLEFGLKQEGKNTLEIQKKLENGLYKG
ncbi:hypothetical protein K9M48_04050 [Candidatus Gracilibacteria bacterium]|nr:hypothetical protein [Candidatus Gracilibacteria bacterium]